MDGLILYISNIHTQGWWAELVADEPYDKPDKCLMRLWHTEYNQAGISDDRVMLDLWGPRTGSKHSWSASVKQSVVIGNDWVVVYGLWVPSTYWFKTMILSLFGPSTGSKHCWPASIKQWSAMIRSYSSNIGIRDQKFYRPLFCVYLFKKRG